MVVNFIRKGLLEHKQKIREKQKSDKIGLFAFYRAFVLEPTFPRLEKDKSVLAAKCALLRHKGRQMLDFTHILMLWKTNKNVVLMISKQTCYFLIFINICVIFLYDKYVCLKKLFKKIILKIKLWKLIMINKPYKLHLLLCIANKLVYFNFIKSNCSTFLYD